MKRLIIVVRALCGRLLVGFVHNRLLAESPMPTN